MDAIAVGDVVYRLNTCYRREVKSTHVPFHTFFARTYGLQRDYCEQVASKY